jgi:hypothetical protein
MERALLITALILVAFALGVSVIAAIVSRGGVVNLRRQVSQLQAAPHDKAAVSTGHEIADPRNEVTALIARLNGEHKDVITCGDLQNMGLQNTYGVTVDNQGNVNLDQTPVTLPPHCINQQRDANENKNCAGRRSGDNRNSGMRQRHPPSRPSSSSSGYACRIAASHNGSARTCCPSSPAYVPSGSGPKSRGL